MLKLIFPRIYYCGAYPAGGTSSNLQEELKVGNKNQLNKQGKPVSDLNTENSPVPKWGPWLCGSSEVFSIILSNRDLLLRSDFRQLIHI